jgi:hypothetical protein
MFVHVYRQCFRGNVRCVSQIYSSRRHVLVSVEAIANLEDRATHFPQFTFSAEKFTERNIFDWATLFRVSIVLTSEQTSCLLLNGFAGL